MPAYFYATRDRFPNSITKSKAVHTADSHTKTHLRAIKTNQTNQAIKNTKIPNDRRLSNCHITIGNHSYQLAYFFVNLKDHINWSSHKNPRRQKNHTTQCCQHGTAKQYPTQRQYHKISQYTDCGNMVKDDMLLQACQRVRRKRKSPSFHQSCHTMYDLWVSHGNPHKYPELTEKIIEILHSTNKRDLLTKSPAPPMQWN